MILLFLSIIMGEAWNVIGGYTGQYSVGHAAYFGVGAYITMMLLQFKQVPPWYGVWAAVAVAVGVVRLVIGSITFRLRGPYFVLASIAVAEIIRLVRPQLQGPHQRRRGHPARPRSPALRSAAGSSPTSARRCPSTTSASPWR